MAGSPRAARPVLVAVHVKLEQTAGPRRHPQRTRVGQGRAERIGDARRLGRPLCARRALLMHQVERPHRRQHDRQQQFAAQQRGRARDVRHIHQHAGNQRHGIQRVAIAAQCRAGLRASRQIGPKFGGQRPARALGAILGEAAIRCGVPVHVRALTSCRASGRRFSRSRCPPGSSSSRRPGRRSTGLRRSCARRRPPDRHRGWCRPP